LYCVRKTSKENIRNLHMTKMISLVLHSFDATQCHDAMPQSVRWRRQLGGGSSLAAAAWWRRQQLGGSVAGNETEARWWRQLSFS
jgi:hypothetical protein